MKFLIDFVNTATDAQIKEYMQINQCTVLKEWDNYDKVFLVEAINPPPLTGLTERVAEEATLEIKPLDIINVNSYYGTHRDPNIEKIVVSTNDTKDWWKNFSYATPEFNQPTLELSRLGDNISVYIMDSGIERTHPEFVDANITNLYTVTPGDYNDNEGHGTALSSVIVGKTCGITNAKLKVVKIFDPDHVTLESELLDALDAIINDHVDNTWSVLNCSWAIPKNEWVEYKLRVLADEGIFIVASSGNEGTSIEDVTPASMIDAITVGAYNKDLKPCDFSNYTGGSLISVSSSGTNHGELDGWAPGEEIWAAGLNGAYGYVAGTSIAAAIVSAITASNIHWWADDDATKTKGYENIFISTAVVNSTNTIFSRKDLLELNDPKYSNSTNAIATLRTRDSYSSGNPVDEFVIAIRAGESKALTRVMQPTLTKSIEFIDPLPANFEILPDGRIHGNPSLDQGPTDSSPYKQYTSKFIRTLLTDVSETVTLDIYVMAPNLEPDTLPTDDPVKIKLQLQACIGFPLPNCTTGGQGNCDNQCSGDCCAGPSKSPLQCDCL